jgi:hypothetical protein
MRNVRAAITLRLSGDEIEPLRDVLRELVSHEDATRHLAGLVSGLSVRYDMGAGEHPLLGLRMPPSRELERADGTRTRVADLLRAARGVLVTADDRGETARLAAGWADRVDVVTGHWAAGPPSDPYDAVEEVLIRPDGHVAWTSPGGGDLSGALSRWFGSASTAAARPAAALS